MTVKESIMEAIHRLPDDVDFKDVADEIAFLAALRQAEDEIAQGKTVSNEDVRKKLEQWTSK